MQLFLLLGAIGATYASPIEKRQSCVFGSYQCAGQALQQCSYGAGSVLSFSTIETCSSGTYCVVSGTNGYTGCLVGTAPSQASSSTVGKPSSTSAPPTSTTLSVAATSKTTAPATTSPPAVTGVPCFPAYNSALGYNGGSKVSYNNVNYINSYYENAGWVPGPGANPSDGGWVSQGACGAGGVTSTSTSLPLSSLSSSAVATSKSASKTTPSPLPTNGPSTGGTYVNMVVGYWGAHPGSGELPLKSYCDPKIYTHINLAFITGFNPVVFDSDISARPNGYGPAQIAADIQYCQSIGIKIGASIGGYTGSIVLGAGTGVAIANDLWNNFMGGSTPLASRYLPGVALDGIDLDIEAGGNSIGTLGVTANPGYAELANQLRSLIVASGRQFYISAAPQCSIPDENMDYVLRNGWFDFVSVQFYSAPCGIGFTGAPNGGPNYADNSSVWNHGQGSWMTQSALWPNRNAKIVVGVPASSSAGVGGGGSDPYPYIQQYVPAWKALNPGLFGGVMWWDCFWQQASGFDGTRYLTFLKSLP